MLLLAKNGFGTCQQVREANGPQPHLPVSPCALQPRLYPVVPGNSRVPDKDIHVGNYIIPKNVSSAYGSISLSHLSLLWPLSCNSSPQALQTLCSPECSGEILPKAAPENFPNTHQNLPSSQSTQPLLHIPPCIPDPKLTSLCFSLTRHWSLCVTMLLQGTLLSSQSQILFVQLAGWGKVQPPTHLRLFPLALASAAAWGGAWQSLSCKWLWPR